MSGMAEVLAAHEMDYTYDGKQTGCSCGHWQPRGPVSAHADHADHQAAALTAAGFGDVREAQDCALREAADLIEPFSGIGLANGATRADVAQWLRARASAVRGEG